MTPLDFMGFMVLLAVALLVAAILHYGLKFYIVSGHWSFASKVIVGYVGAMYGPAFFGHWFEGLVVGGVYLLPAALGAFALVVLIIDVVKTLRHS